MIGARVGFFSPQSTLDADALAYLTAVESADGQSLEVATRTAINDFVVGCKSDGIFSALKSACILMGARTLSGALVPLVGTAPTNNNFVSGDYNRKTGILGNKSTKYINTNRNANADPQNSFHLSNYITALPNNASTIIGAGLSGSNGTSALVRGAGPLISRNRNGSNSTGFGGGSVSAFGGFFGTSRDSSAAFTERYGGSTQTNTQTSQTPYNQNICVFLSLASGAYSDHRCAFYSIGTSLDLSLLDSRLTTLYNAISAAF